MTITGITPLRPWERGPGRPTYEAIPFPDHRNLAEVWSIENAAYRRLLAERRKPTSEDDCL